LEGVIGVPGGFAFCGIGDGGDGVGGVDSVPLGDADGSGGSPVRGSLCGKPLGSPVRGSMVEGVPMGGAGIDGGAGATGGGVVTGGLLGRVGTGRVCAAAVPAVSASTPSASTT
jgi:hypothetical protein